MIKNKVLEKKRWNGHDSSDIINLLNIHVPKCDYMYISDLDKRISKILNIPKKYVTKVRLAKCDYIPNNPRFDQEKFLIENAFEYSFPKSFFGPYMIECKNDDCYELQTYSTKSSLLRILGFEHSAYNTTKNKNKGLCGKCSRSAKRKGWTHSPEIVERMRETAILHQTPYDSMEEWAKADRKKRRWYEICDKMSRVNLEKFQPDEYKRFMENKYDGTNYETGLTIEHIRPKSECFETNELLECSDSSNLKVVTMKENNRLWAGYVEKNDIKNGRPIKVTKNQTHNFW